MIEKSSFLKEFRYRTMQIDPVQVPRSKFRLDSGKSVFSSKVMPVAQDIL